MNNLKDSNPTHYAVVADRIFSCTGNKNIEGKAVIVKDDCISEIVPEEVLSPKIEKIKIPGTTLMPGFIDTHIHLNDWSIPLCLANGQTTVRDVGNVPDWIFNEREKSQSKCYIGPQIYCCGPILDGKEPIKKSYWGIKNTEDMVKAIEYLSNRKVDGIKLYSGLDVELIKTAVHLGKIHNLPVLGHFGVETSLINAIRAGVGEIEHLEVLPDKFEKEIVDELVDKNVWVVPTQIVFERWLSINCSLQNMKDLLIYAPEEKIKYWIQYCEDIEKIGVEKVKRFCENHRKYIRAIIEKNGRIAVGTDAPCNCVVPGFTYNDELFILSECGMSNSDVLKTATIKSAELLGISEKTGSIEKGKLADLIIVKGDPITRLHDINNIEMVIKKGQRFYPKDILFQAIHTSA